VGKSKQQENAFEIANKPVPYMIRLKGFVADLIKIGRKSTKLKPRI
jgi:hypothetical protein